MKQFRQHMVVSLSQKMLSPAHYEDGIDNVKNQGNTVNKSGGNGSAQKSARKKERSTDPPNRSRDSTEQQSLCRQGRLSVQLEYTF